ncbi:hypothetical protein [Paraburkholderia sp. BL21I4N1]|uniref:hypothetical protein n=1 Tax=Paraburkholderia sp. BL21I4N1 TaxID=1938801 RepID=UPI000CFCB22B|nr:hypothetical protein [Paraburkholderia sp. BL21I4N1]PQV50990.1 hypothetical protein B0G83_105353 [Paraburkholderia sp. BL21I4N1]
MSAINVNSSRTNTTTHRAVLDGTELERIIGEYVASMCGIDPGSPGVNIQCRLSSRMGSYSVINEGLVTITVDHAAAPVEVSE